MVLVQNQSPEYKAFALFLIAQLWKPREMKPSAHQMVPKPWPLSFFPIIMVLKVKTSNADSDRIVNENAK